MWQSIMVDCPTLHIYLPLLDRAYEIAAAARIGIYDWHLRCISWHGEESKARRGGGQEISRSDGKSMAPDPFALFRSLMLLRDQNRKQSKRPLVTQLT
jgi:hypothetical protein